jgi:hypothetical protein
MSVGEHNSLTGGGGVFGELALVSPEPNPCRPHGTKTRGEGGCSVSNYAR